MSLSLRYAARSDLGLLRDGNEDSGYAGPRLLAVADGMGGAAAGEVASSVVIATLAPLDDDVPGSEMLDTLAHAVEEANEKLRDLVRDNTHLEGMGTTLTALLWASSRLGLVHVGDSRAYLLREDELQQITHDHTWVQRLVDEGRITEDEADHHPQRSLLMRAIDGRGNVDLDLSIREVRPGDRLLVCSDGLSSVVSHDTIAATLSRGEPEQAVDALIELALRAGGPDNVTCIVADVVESGTPTPTVPQVVGAAAERSDRGPTAHDSAAGRAAALRPTDGDPDGDPDPAPVGGRGLRRVLLPVLLLAVLIAAASYAGYRWSQTQYYVGAHDGQVAIYQGLPQQVLGLNASSLYEVEEEAPLDDLTRLDRQRVEETISVDSLAHARRVVNNLSDRAQECAEAKEKLRRQELRGPPAEEPAAEPTATPDEDGSTATTDSTTQPQPPADDEEGTDEVTEKVTLPPGCEESAS